MALAFAAQMEDSDHRADAEGAADLVQTPQVQTPLRRKGSEDPAQTPKVQPKLMRFFLVRSLMLKTCSLWRSKV